MSCSYIACFLRCCCVCAALIANKAKEISRLNSVYNNLLRNAGVAYYEGKGSLLDKNTVQVGCMWIDAEGVHGMVVDLHSTAAFCGPGHAACRREAPCWCACGWTLGSGMGQAADWGACMQLYRLSLEAVTQAVLSVADACGCR
jgi:hypothetical protein